MLSLESYIDGKTYGATFINVIKACMTYKRTKKYVEVACLHGHSTNKKKHISLGKNKLTLFISMINKGKVARKVKKTEWELKHMHNKGFEFKIEIAFTLHLL